MKNLLLVIFLFSSNLALATESNPIMGMGSASCGKYLDQQKDDVGKLLHITWAQGWISGMNFSIMRSGKKPPRFPDAETIQLYISNYCKKNPLDYSFQALLELFNELNAREEDIRKKP